MHKGGFMSEESQWEGCHRIASESFVWDINGWNDRLPLDSQSSVQYSIAEAAFTMCQKISNIQLQIEWKFSIQCALSLKVRSLISRMNIFNLSENQNRHGHETQLRTWNSLKSHGHLNEISRSLFAKILQIETLRHFSNQIYERYCVTNISSSSK